MVHLTAEPCHVSAHLISPGPGAARCQVRICDLGERLSGPRAAGGSRPHQQVELFVVQRHQRGDAFAWLGGRLWHIWLAARLMRRSEPSTHWSTHWGRGGGEGGREQPRWPVREILSTDAWVRGEQTEGRARHVWDIFNNQMSGDPPASPPWLYVCVLEILVQVCVP